MTFQQFMEQNRGLSIEQACQHYGVGMPQLFQARDQLLSLLRK